MVKERRESGETRRVKGYLSLSPFISSRRENMWVRKGGGPFFFLMRRGQEIDITFK